MYRDGTPDMNRYSYLLLAFLSLPIFACEGLVDTVNENPNQIAAADIEAQQYLKGAQLANISVQAGHLQRIAASWSGQLTGHAGTYQRLYEYELKATDADATWASAYHGVLTQVRYIRSQLPTRRLYQGMAKVLEAHAVGTMASLFGDIPYSEALNESIDAPAFDDQKTVFAALQVLLDSAIADLEAAPVALISSDLYYAGDKEKWKEAAWTLKARYFLLTREYAAAYSAARAGISSPENTLQFTPQAGDGTADKNLFYSLLSGPNAGELDTGGSHLMQLLDESTSISRDHAKTQEAARMHYLTILADDAAANLGVAHATEPMPLISYAENLLIEAETGARTESMIAGITPLNEWRAHLRSGNAFPVLDPTDGLMYDDLFIEDFVTGGIENQDAVDMDRALLREIIEERFVAGFGQWMPFDDARRLRLGDEDIAIPIPVNTTTARQHPERFIYAQNETTANPNAPADPGIFAPTAVNE